MGEVAQVLGGRAEDAGVTDLAPRPAAVAPTEGDDTTPLGRLWLSHHYACDADRCVRLGATPVCRRCLFIFVGFVPALLVLASSWADDLQAGDQGLVLALTITAGIEFAQVVRGRAPYSARRVVLLSPAVGAVMAWLAVTGARDGLGPLHLVSGAAAVVLLGVLFARGTVLRRGAHPAA